MKKPPLSWLMLLYQIPARASTRRVYVWRKLKGAGVVYWKDSVCLLPFSAVHKATLAALADEIRGVAGEVTLTEIQFASAAEEQAMVKRFRAQADEEYTEFLGKCRDFHAELAKERHDRHFTFAELEENEAELSKLTTWLPKAAARDFFGGTLAGKAAAALKACSKELDTYAKEVAKAEEGALKPAGKPAKKRRRS